MKIAVDARSVYQEKTLRGVGQSLLGLYKGLSRARPSWSFDMYYQISNDTNPFAGCANIQGIKIDGPGDRFGAWQNLWLPFRSRLKCSSLLHAHGAIAPRKSLVPLLTTIHDLTPLEFWPKDPAVIKWGQNVARGAKQARRVLTCSHHTKNEVVEKFGISESKIEVVYWGPNELYNKVTDMDFLSQIRGSYGLEANQQFLLHFGMALPRKNTSRLLASWAALPVSIRKDSRLVIVGLEGESLNDFATKVSDWNIGDSVKLYGYIPTKDVPALLSIASGLCYIPLSEGFGLPILDAFQCDTPVIASRVTSIPEIAGNAAHLVDPTSSTDITDAMLKVLVDQNYREELIVGGRNRLNLFSWSNCAEQVATIFQSVV